MRSNLSCCSFCGSFFHRLYSWEYIFIIIHTYRYYGGMHFFYFYIVIQNNVAYVDWYCRKKILWHDWELFSSKMCILPHCICSLSITQLNICVHIYACVHIVLYIIGICSRCILLICTVKCLYNSNKTAHLRKLTCSSIIPKYAAWNSVFLFILSCSLCTCVCFHWRCSINPAYYCII